MIAPSLERGLHQCREFGNGLGIAIRIALTPTDPRSRAATVFAPGQFAPVAAGLGEDAHQPDREPFVSARRGHAWSALHTDRFLLVKLPLATALYRDHNINGAATMTVASITHSIAVNSIQPARQRLRLGLTLLLMSLWVPGWVTAQSRAGIGATTEVRLFVLPDCGYCDRARSYLQARQVRFNELDIAADAQAKADFDRLGGAGTPLIVIGDQVIHGFDPSRIDAALAGD